MLGCARVNAANRPVNLMGVPMVTGVTGLGDERHWRGVGRGLRVRIGLVGCVKSKLTVASPARDLYTSTLFVGRRRFVEASCDRWFILSAKHGVVDPDAILEPYDETLKTASRAARRAWSQRVLSALDAELGDISGLCFETHAGAEYLEYGVADGLLQRGATAHNPTQGMRIGEQLSFYSGKRS